jgi:hypothetical protein
MVLPYALLAATLLATQASAQKVGLNVFTEWM